MTFSCPHCSAELELDSSYAGTATNCPDCGGRFQVPLPTAGGGPSTDPDVQAFASKKIAAGICGILLGGLGVHKFILGFTAAGVIMLSVWLVGFITGLCVGVPLLASIAMNIIGLIEGILYLTKSDADFYETYAIRRKDWF
jgi:TM2 domain-containing membrane protein YozV